MNKGQLCVEALSAVGLVMVYLALICGLSIGMQEEAADRNMRLIREAGCEGLSSMIDAVYAAGDGAEVEYRVAGNYTVHPGFVQSADGGYFCGLSEAAVGGPISLPAGTHIIRNGGDWIEFP